MTHSFSSFPTVTHGPQIDLPPEILLWIGRHLIQADFALCVRVSRLWHAMFSPLLYKILDLRVTQTPVLDPWSRALSEVFVQRPVLESLGPFGYMRPSPNAFFHYGRHIKHFAIDRVVLSNEPFLTTILYLKDLRLEGGGQLVNPTRHLALSRYLFINNPRILTLDLQDCTWSEELSNVALWCRNLERLRLGSLTFSLLALAGILKACPSLVHLSVIGCSVFGSKARPLWDNDSKLGLRELELEVCSGHESRYLFDLVPRCHQLTSITVRYFKSRRNGLQVRLGHCQSLSKVTLMDCRHIAEVALVLNSCPKTLQELSIINCIFDKCVVRSIQRHAKTLTKFRLVGLSMTTAVTGVDMTAATRQLAAEKLLTELAFQSCPNLIHLECPGLTFVAKSARTADNKSHEMNDNRESGRPHARPHSLKTLKIGMLIHRPSTGGKASTSHMPAMTGVEEIVCSKIFVYDDSNHLMAPGKELAPEGTFGRSQLEQEKKLQWMLKLWPKLTRVVNGN